MIKEIFSFNRDVLGISPLLFPRRLPETERAWLLAALAEECEEFGSSRSIEDDVDSLIDLIYFAVGGLYRHGLTEEQAARCFQAVHSANWEKKLGVVESRPNDGTVADAVKPSGWADPKIAIGSILKNG